MTEVQARTTANVVLAAAVIGAACYVLKTPPLRRKVWQVARLWAAGPLAAWTATEVRRAWDESASARATASYIPPPPASGTRWGMAEPVRLHPQLPRGKR